MFGLFITIIIVITLVASVGYAIFTLQKSSDIASITQRNVVRMETMVTLIRASSRPTVAGGAVRLPVGDEIVVYDGGPSRTVPPALIVGDDRTPWGARYGYCPAAIVDGASDQAPGASVEDEVLGGGAGYVIGVKTVAGAGYVVTADAPAVSPVGSTLPASPVLGFIVSPSPNQFELPLCGEIIYRDGAYLIGAADIDEDGVPDGAPTVGGTVAAIPLGVSSLDFAAADMDPTLYVSVDAPANRTGTSADEAMRLSEAVEYWKTSTPRTLVLKLANGEYDVSDIDLSFLTANPGRFFRITDDTPQDPVGASLISATPKYMTFGVDGGLDGVTLSSSIGVRTLAGTRVGIDGATIGELRVDGGDVVLTSRSRILHDGRPGSPIGVAGGHLSIAQFTSSALEIDSSSVAMVVKAGTVLVSADLSAPDSPLPWEVTGSGRLEVGLTLAGAPPNVTYSGYAGAMELTKTVNGTGDAIALASCPPSHPYVVHASCAADRGALRSSSLITGGSTDAWRCDWSEDAIVGGVGTIPAPASSSVDLVCSANPAR